MLTERIIENICDKVKQVIQEAETLTEGWVEPGVCFAGHWLEEREAEVL